MLTLVPDQILGNVLFDLSVLISLHGCQHFFSLNFYKNAVSTRIIPNMQGKEVHLI